MDITFGKHSGKSLELVLLRHPDYVAWMLGQSANGSLRAMQREANRLIAIFDAKALDLNCQGHTPPPHAATLCTVYGNNVSVPYWWCDECDPHEAGAIHGKLQKIRTYQQALNHVQFHCNGRAGDYKSLIKDLAEAKRLPKRVGDQQAIAFFA